MVGLELGDVMGLMPAAAIPNLSKIDAVPALGALKDNFSAALSSALAADTTAAAAPPTTPPLRLAAADSQTATDATGGQVDSVANAQGRARRALQLNPSQSVKSLANGGDTILDGLQKIRGEFNGHNTRLNALMARRTADFNTMIALQGEVARFALLVDVTAKLTGKSAQALEALLKG
jgi:type III secretion system YscI/HrpB-like protein